MKYYYDRRKLKYVTENEINFNFVAPEIYYEFCCGENNNECIETWEYSDNNNIFYIDFVYTIDDEIYNIQNERENLFNKMNIKPYRLSKFTVPPRLFNNEIKRLENNKV